MSTAHNPATGRSFSSVRIAPRREGRARHFYLLLDLILVAWLIWLFDAVNNLAPVRQRLAERDGERVLSLERSLHLAPEHALDRWLANRHALSQIVVFWYENIHIAVTLAVLCWLWWQRPDLLGVMRATLVIATLIALATFWSFPVAPPRMIPGGYPDLVALVHHLPVWQLGAVALHSNQLCSMPSLHVAWATWCAITLWRMSERRSLRALALVYPLLTSFAVMATGNHYLFDSAVGATITLAVYHLVVASQATSDARAAILRRVCAIPPGYVRTYGDVSPGAPRLAGYVLRHTDAHDAPWHRVVRADGSLAKGARQRRLLEAEAVPFHGERVVLSSARLDDFDAV